VFAALGALAVVSLADNRDLEPAAASDARTVKRDDATRGDYPAAAFGGANPRR
jgi:hypothetical protein